MAGRNKWRDIRSRTIETRPGSLERVEIQKRLMELDVQLAALRESRGASQRALADALAVTQPNVSRIEREDDILVSTLGRYVEALGGRLEIRAFFPDTVVELRGIRGLRAAAGAVMSVAKSRKTVSKPRRRSTVKKAGQRPTVRRASKAPTARGKTNIVKAPSRARARVKKRSGARSSAPRTEA